MKAELWFKINKSRKNWLSRIISWRQSSPFVHVELVFPDDRIACSSVIGKGVRITSTDELLSEKDAEWFVVPLQIENPVPALSWFFRNEGAPYDMASILEIGAGRSPERLENQAWYCSEACCEAIKQCGVWPAVSSHGVKVDTLYYLALGLFKSRDSLYVRIEVAQ